MKYSYLAHVLSALIIIAGTATAIHFSTKDSSSPKARVSFEGSEPTPKAPAPQQSEGFQENGEKVWLGKYIIRQEDTIYHRPTQGRYVPLTYLDVETFTLHTDRIGTDKTGTYLVGLPVPTYWSIVDQVSEQPVTNPLRIPAGTTDTDIESFGVCASAERSAAYLFRVADQLIYHNWAETGILEGADVETFEFLGVFDNAEGMPYSRAYSKDKNSVYVGCPQTETILGQADVATFELLEDGFAKDRSNIWHLGRELQGVDYDTFEVLRIGYARDVDTLYRENFVLEDINPDEAILQEDENGNLRLYVNGVKQPRNTRVHP